MPSRENNRCETHLHAGDLLQLLLPEPVSRKPCTGPRQLGARSPTRSCKMVSFSLLFLAAGSQWWARQLVLASM